jgi:predicted esterase
MRLTFAPLFAAMSTTTGLTPPETKKRILCLHGGMQSGAILSNKISGARRKLAREYDLHFLDAPIVVLENSISSSSTETTGPQLAWWTRNEHGKHMLVQEAFEYVVQQTKGESYDVLLGFSQGGVLATALALSGAIPNVRAVVTAGSPMVDEAFQVARIMANNDEATVEHGKMIPKYHFAGETDAMVPVESTRTMCQEGGNGVLVLHEKGHMFPTRAQYVNEMMEFLSKSLC